METTKQEVDFADEKSHLLEIESEVLQKNSTIWPQLFSSIVVLFSSLSMGFVVGYSSPTLQELRDAGYLDSLDQESWYGSIHNIGAVLGGPVAAFAVDKLGRKVTLIVIQVPHIIGWLVLMLANSSSLLLFGRFLTAVSIGANSMVVPIYLAEITTVKLRGPMICAFSLFARAGILVVYGLGVSLNFRQIALTLVIYTLVQGAMMFFVPETPRYLIKTGKYDTARESLQWLRGKAADIDEEYSAIQTSILASHTGNLTLREIVKAFRQPQFYRPLLISTALMFFQQFSGINAMNSYLEDIFVTAGFDEDPQMPVLISATVFVLLAIPSCFITEHVGRRTLSIVSGIASFVSLIIFGLFYYLTDVKEVEGIQWLSIVIYIVYIIGFSIGLAPIAWVFTAETFPLKTKGMGSSLATSSNWLCSFVVTKTFPLMTNTMKSYGTFWFYGVICLISSVFAYFCMPETKGKTLEQISVDFEKNNNYEVIE